MVSSIAVYVAVSLLSPGEGYDLDKLLKRGKYRVEEEYKVVEKAPTLSAKWLGMGEEFTWGDKLIYILSYGYTFLITGIFLIGCLLALFYDFTDIGWMKFWYGYVIVLLIISAIVTVWFTIGGVKDIRKMLDRLKTMERDASDDGQIQEES